MTTTDRLLRLIKKHPEYNYHQLSKLLDGVSLDYLRGTMARLRASGATKHRVPTKNVFSGEFTAEAKKARKARKAPEKGRTTDNVIKLTFPVKPQYSGRSSFTDYGYRKLM